MNAILSQYHRAFSGLPVAVWLFSLVLFVHRSGTMVLPFLSLHLKDHLGLSASSATQMLSFYGVGSIFGSIAGGVLTKRIGAIRTVILSLLAVSPVFLLLLRAETVIAAAGAMCLLSLVGDVVRPAAMTATAEFCPNDKLSRAFALNRLAVNLGMSIGPAIAGLLYRSHFELIFYVDSVTCLAAALMVLAFFGWKRGKVPTIEKAACEQNQSRPFWQDGVLMLVLTMFCLVMMIFLQNIATYPIYLRDHYGMLESSIGLLFTINTAMIVLFEMVLVTSLEKYPKLPIIGAGCVMICLGYGVLPLGASVAFVCATVVLWTLGEMLSMPLLTTWIGHRAPPERRASYMSAMTTLFSVAWVISPVLGGFLYALHPDLIWYCSLFLALVVAIGFLSVSASEARNKQKVQLDSQDDYSNTDGSNSEPVTAAS